MHNVFSWIKLRSRQTMRKLYLRLIPKEEPRQTHYIETEKIDELLDSPVFSHTRECKALHSSHIWTLTKKESRKLKCTKKYILSTMRMYAALRKQWEGITFVSSIVVVVAIVKLKITLSVQNSWCTYTNIIHACDTLDWMQIPRHKTLIQFHTYHLLESLMIALHGHIILYS